MLSTKPAVRRCLENENSLMKEDKKLCAVVDHPLLGGWKLRTTEL
jgi:hypothetical protein